MSGKCVACQSEINSLDSTTDVGIRAVLNTEGEAFYDGIAKYCSEECAPAELTNTSHDTSPLQALVEFFHSENTTESIEYWTESRGWNRETVDSLLLGWAPPDNHKAYNHLRKKGYSNADILSTGAFYSGKPPYTCIWTGRYVFPYYNSDGTAAYMISRRVPADQEFKDIDSSGHPKDPQGDRKYSKLTKSSPYSIHDEPIYGIESLETGCDVVVAEGIADAISAIEKGYHVLSPVTNSFKNKHYSEVAELLESNSVNTVYIVPDSEEVQESQKESGLDVSVGLYGGLKNAIELQNRVEETNIQIVELPRDSGVSKVDLDEYLQSHSKAEFDRLIEKSDDPESFEEYDTIKERVEMMNTATQEDSEYNRNVTGETSELFEITLLDVLPDDFNPNIRNPNPLGHTGDTKDYFAVKIEAGNTVAYDFKRDVAYNALTYILCKIGERPLEAPNGSLSDREIWLAWKWCKENDIFINDNDPIPSSALNHLARELGYEVGDEMLPYDVYAETVEYVQEEYNLNPGRELKSNSSKNSPNTFFTIPVEGIMEIPDDRSTYKNRLPDGFSYQDPVWKCDTIQNNPKDTLSLLAILEEYITVDELQEYKRQQEWTELLTNKEMLTLSLMVSRHFDVEGSDPPYKALLGLAEELDMEINDTLTIKQQNKLIDIFYSSSYDPNQDKLYINSSSS